MTRKKKNFPILKFLFVHKFILELKHLQFFAKLFADSIAALSTFVIVCFTYQLHVSFH